MPSSDLPLPAALRGRASFVLARLGSLARQQCTAQLATVGLSQHQHAILCCLADYGPGFQRDIAARLGLDSGDIVAFLDGLERHGLLQRERDPDDRRRQVVSLTPAGEQRLREAEDALDAAEPGILAALSESERAELTRLAGQVLARPGARRGVREERA